MIDVKYFWGSKPEPDDRKADAVLDGIIADLRSLLRLSRTQVRYFAQIKKADHAARRAALTDSAARLRERLDQDYARMRTLNNDPLTLQSDEGKDTIELLNDAARQAPTDQKGIV